MQQFRNKEKGLQWWWRGGAAAVNSDAVLAEYKSPRGGRCGSRVVEGFVPLLSAALWRSSGVKRLRRCGAAAAATFPLPPLPETTPPPASLSPPSPHLGGAVFLLRKKGAAWRSSGVERLRQ
ncbi:uncharacterized protein DS421_1g23790 [Arachis hypogaea]|nr:uncharacterized protein DS421_1g23790 [Arachis hypogaea]